jgi:hypothetical protein
METALSSYFIKRNVEIIPYRPHVRLFGVMMRELI